MAVVKVTESWKQSGAAVEGWPGVKPIIVGTHRRFSVKFDVASPNNQLNAVVANDGTTAIPAVGSYWGNAATYLTCRRVQVLDPIGPTIYRVVERWFLGYKKLKDSANPYLRLRAERLAVGEVHLERAHRHPHSRHLHLEPQRDPFIRLDANAQ